jgi:hypothetical protein
MGIPGRGTLVPAWERVLGLRSRMAETTDGILGGGGLRWR